MKHRFLRMVALGSLLAILIGPAFCGPSAPRFSISDLGTLPGGQESAAYALNDREQVVGWSDSGVDNEANFHKEMIHNHAVLWDRGNIHDLGLLKGFSFSAARAINHSGQIVGGWDIHYRPGNGGGVVGLRQTFLWQNGQKTLLVLDAASAVNDHGQVAGTVASDAGSRAVLWTKNKTTMLPLPEGFTESRAYALNSARLVAGSATRDNGHGLDYHAILWRSGKPVDLGLLPPGNGGPDSEAFGINDAGEVAGSSNGRAFLWKNGKMQGIGFLSPSYAISRAYGINSREQIVGEADNAASNDHHAFLWQNGVMYDLNSLIPKDSGWTLEEAKAINTQGQIVGWGQHGGKQHAFLLTPVKTAP